MNKTLTSLFLAAIQATFKHHLQNNFVGITTQLLWQIFQFFLDRYGRVTPQNINDNLKIMKATWEPQNPIEKWFLQINDAFEYSIFLQQPIPNTTFVQS